MYIFSCLQEANSFYISSFVSVLVESYSISDILISNACILLGKLPTPFSRFSSSTTLNCCISHSKSTYLIGLFSFFLSILTNFIFIGKISTTKNNMFLFTFCVILQKTPNSLIFSRSLFADFCRELPIIRTTDKVIVIICCRFTTRIDLLTDDLHLLK